MIKFLGTSAIAFAAMLLVNIESAEAQGYIGSGNYSAFGGVGGFFGGFSSPYAASRIPTPPYFAIHPPVYYSAPVARTYGYSVFPYSGDVRTPDLPMPAKEMKNPHAKPMKNAKSTKESRSLLDLTMKIDDGVVENPFVNQTKTKLIRLSN